MLVKGNGAQLEEIRELVEAGKVKCIIDHVVPLEKIRWVVHTLVCWGMEMHAVAL